MSLRYTVEGFFQFFKVDVEASETVAKKQDVAYGFGTELPILVMYKNGVEERRFPMKDKKGHTLQAKYYSKKELINFFDLESIYVDCTSSAK